MTRKTESTTHVMLDLETMGNGPDAAIVAIGAVAFDTHEQRIHDSYYSVVSLATSVREGGLIDASTVIWWMDQADEARHAITRGMAVDIIDALTNFTDWFDGLALDPETVPVWGNGAGFDNVILRRAYERAGHETPWSHWQDRCYRTAVKMMDPQRQLLSRSGTHHNALDDARTQAEHLLAMLQAQRAAA